MALEARANFALLRSSTHLEHAGLPKQLLLPSQLRHSCLAPRYTQLLANNLLCIWLLSDWLSIRCRTKHAS